MSTLLSPILFLFVYEILIQFPLTTIFFIREKSHLLLYCLSLHIFVKVQVNEVHFASDFLSNFVWRRCNDNVLSYTSKTYLASPTLKTKKRKAPTIPKGHNNHLTRICTPHPLKDTVILCQFCSHPPSLQNNVKIHTENGEKKSCKSWELNSRPAAYNPSALVIALSRPVDATVEWRH